MIESKIVTIPYPSEAWSDAMANANRADKEFVPGCITGSITDRTQEIKGEAR